MGAHSALMQVVVAMRSTYTKLNLNHDQIAITCSQIRVAFLVRDETESADAYPLESIGDPRFRIP